MLTWLTNSDSPVPTLFLRMLCFIHSQPMEATVSALYIFVSQGFCCTKNSSSALPSLDFHCLWKALHNPRLRLGGLSLSLFPPAYYTSKHAEASTWVPSSWTRMTSFVGWLVGFKVLHQIFNAGSSDYAYSCGSAPREGAELSVGLQWSKPWMICHCVTMVQGYPFSRHRHF